MSVIQGPKARNLLLREPDILTGIFKQTLVIQFILTTLVMLSIYGNNYSIDAIGLSFLRNIGYTLLLIALGFLFLAFVYKRALTSEKLETIYHKHREINYIMPRNKSEYQWAIVLSFGVGFMEEILYRGFLFWQLNMHMPLIVAVLLTNIVFGFLHFGTGKKNAMATFWLGMVFSGLSIPFDTLWFAILAHSVIDIYTITTGYKAKVHHLSKQD